MSYTPVKGDYVLNAATLGILGQIGELGGGFGTPLSGVVTNATGPVVLWANGRLTTYTDTDNVILVKIAPTSVAVQAFLHKQVKIALIIGTNSMGSQTGRCIGVMTVNNGTSDFDYLLIQFKYGDVCMMLRDFCAIQETNPNVNI